jgi:hypothetical protein
MACTVYGPAILPGNYGNVNRGLENNHGIRVTIMTIASGGEVFPGTALVHCVMSLDKCPQSVPSTERYPLCNSSITISR